MRKTANISTSEAFVKAMPGEWLVLVRSTLALALVMLSGWLLMYSIFPLYDPTFPLARDYSTAAQGVVFVLIALGAMRRPRLFSIEPLSVVALALGVGGVALAYLGIDRESPLLMVLSSTLLRITMSWFQIVVGVSLTRLNARHLSICIAVALLFSYAGQYLLFLLPSWAGVAAFVAIPFACYLLSVPLARPVFNRFAISESPFDSSVTRPSSFLPFSHHLFICLLVFHVVKGFLISFGEVEGTPLRVVLSPLAILVLACALLVFRWQVRADRLFDIAALLIVAGLLLMPLTTLISAHAIINLMLSSGCACFSFLFWYLLASLSARNPHGAVPAFAWGSALLCFGIVPGAFLGRLTDQYTLTTPLVAIIITAVLTWLFVAYYLLCLKRLSFDATILAIQPDDTPAQVQGNFDSITFVSEQIAHDHGLTPRETEILALLVRGRSGRYIKDDLGVSQNTVKAHVRHIYQKLDIHTHQELIDLIEAQASS
ncbi:MAG: helix-turn-helix transcriptional regulator [Coriobacteriales bacterium]|jgi:DNA-binding CsgD family transcriptional regulator|nr:helix-turn-helix transcriptional regulator [Coriobacteriales bacterium]